jgi:hypothetical protein
MRDFADRAVARDKAGQPQIDPRNRAQDNRDSRHVSDFQRWKNPERNPNRLGELCTVNPRQKVPH